MTQVLSPFAEEIASAILDQQEAGTLDETRARQSIDREEACGEISHEEHERLLHLFCQA